MLLQRIDDFTTRPVSRDECCASLRKFYYTTSRKFSERTILLKKLSSEEKIIVQFSKKVPVSSKKISRDWKLSYSFQRNSVSSRKIPNDWEIILEFSEKVGVVEENFQRLKNYRRIFRQIQSDRKNFPSSGKSFRNIARNSVSLKKISTENDRIIFREIQGKWPSGVDPFLGSRCNRKINVYTSLSGIMENKYIYKR